MCESCDPFNTAITIYGPGQLRRIVEKLQEAVRSDVLQCSAAGSGATTIGHKPFAALELDEEVPDVMVYDFSCNQCNAAFGLRVETYHGQGGSWSKL